MRAISLGWPLISLTRVGPERYPSPPGMSAYREDITRLGFLKKESRGKTVGYVLAAGTLSIGFNSGRSVNNIDKGRLCPNKNLAAAY